MADKRLDVRGMPCPYPILKARKAILELSCGGTLEVLATDPGASEDFAVFAETTGYLLISATEEDGVFRFVLQRPDEASAVEEPVTPHSE
jgi:tRNA 2-thiouridine synthesizing protein A